MYLSLEEILYTEEQICLHVCIRTVVTLDTNRLHIRNQYDQEVRRWEFIFSKSN